MDCLEGLNEEQKEAVTCNARYLRIIAGAGSGKTKVLTRRVVYLIRELGIPSRQILAITFTNKAAGEMKRRIVEMLGTDECAATLKTFHSFCVQILRQDCRVVGYTNDFRIIDKKDQLQLIKDIKKENNLEDIKPAEYLQYIGMYKSAGLSPADAEKECTPDDKPKLLMFVAYQEYLERKNYMDFDDLLINAVKTLRASSYVLEKWRRRYSYILVDEFQDTNDVQYELIKLLCDKNTSLFVVGDPDQTIYTFRGADMDIIMNFKKDFPGTKDVVLTTNYRSTQGVLNAANALIKNNDERVEKDLRAAGEVGAQPLYFLAPSQEKEAEWVVRNIRDTMKKEPGTTYDDFAVVYRSNYYSRAIEQELMKRQIPYQVFGGVKFFEREEIKDALAYLQLVVNPNDDLAFLRVINVPRRGVGDAAKRQIKAFAEEKGVSLYEALRSGAEKITPEVATFYEEIERARKSLRYKGKFHLVMEHLLHNVGYLAYLEAKRKTSRGDDSLDRLANVEELKRVLRHRQQEDSSLKLVELLQEISLAQARDTEKDDERVSLSTIHIAKGLEYPTIFLVGFSHGVLPNARALAQRGKKGLEEERRLAYVAMTRAKKHLFISGAGFDSGDESPGFGSYSESQFAKEIKAFVTPYGPAKKRSASVVESLAGRGSGRSKMVFNDAREPTNRDSWHPGDMLKHRVFGEGILLKTDATTITVAFKDAATGVKIIGKNFAGIEKIGG